MYRVQCPNHWSCTFVLKVKYVMTKYLYKWSIVVCLVQCQQKSHHPHDPHHFISVIRENYAKLLIPAEIMNHHNCNIYQNNHNMMFFNHHSGLV